MRPRRPLPSRPPSRRWRQLLLVSCGVIALSVLIGAVFLFTRRTTHDDPALKEPEPAPLDSMSWPSVRPEATSTVREARGGLERARSLYDQGQRDSADALVVSSLGDLERSGSLIPALGAYHYETLRTAVARNDFSEAERRAQRWLEKFPADFDHLFFLGKARYQLRKWSKAAECFRGAARTHPESVEVLRWLGQTCAQMGAQDEAVSAVKQSLERIGYPQGDYWSHPLAKQVLGNAVMVLHRFQEYDLLAEVADAYRRKRPEDGEAAMAEGVALANIGRYAEAEPLLRQAGANPGNAENADQISFALGLALGKQGKWQEATRVLTVLLGAEPFYSKGYYQLGLALARLGRQAEADAMIAKSRDLAPSEREIRREKELRAAGQPGRAAVAASLAYSLRGEPQRAEQALRSPELQSDPYAVFALADFYLDCLRVAEAENVLTYAAGLVGPTHADVTGRQALAARARGENEKASAGLRAAASRELPDPAWKLALARALVDDGKPADAVALLEPLRRSDSDREASYLLGRALLENGDPRRALEMLRSISTADTRWESWEAGTWLALAILLAPPDGGAAAVEAQGILDTVPPHARSTHAYLRARVLLLESQGNRAAELAAANEALRRHDEAEPGIAALKRQIASTPWTESAPLRLQLAKLYLSRGETKEALRHARLALQAAPASIEPLRALAEWLSADSEVFLRLKALHDLAKLAPQDESIGPRIQAIEAQWLRVGSAAGDTPK